MEEAADEVRAGAPDQLRCIGHRAEEDLHHSRSQMQQHVAKVTV